MRFFSHLLQFLFTLSATSFSAMPFYLPVPVVGTWDWGACIFYFSTTHLLGQVHAGLPPAASPGCLNSTILDFPVFSLFHLLLLFYYHHLLQLHTHIHRNLFHHRFTIRSAFSHLPPSTTPFTLYHYTPHTILWGLHSLFSSDFPTPANLPYHSILTIPSLPPSSFTHILLFPYPPTGWTVPTHTHYRSGGLPFKISPTPHTRLPLRQLIHHLLPTLPLHHTTHHHLLVDCLLYGLPAFLRFPAYLHTPHTPPPASYTHILEGYLPLFLRTIYRYVRFAISLLPPFLPFFFCLLPTSLCSCHIMQFCLFSLTCLFPMVSCMHYTCSACTTTISSTCVSFSHTLSLCTFACLFYTTLVSELPPHCHTTHLLTATNFLSILVHLQDRRTLPHA